MPIVRRVEIRSKYAVFFGDLSRISCQKLVESSEFRRSDDREKLISKCKLGLFVEYDSNQQTKHRNFLMPDERLRQFFAREIPSFYANSFEVSITSSDVRFELLLNGQPAAVLNLSYTAAKSLVEKLGELMANLEGATGTSIMTSDVVNEHMQRWIHEARGGSDLAQERS